MFHYLTIFYFLSEQQITLYPHKDENNWWRITKQYSNATSEIEWVNDGDVVRLEHFSTNKRLHAHDVRPPMTDVEYHNEVRYVRNNVSPYVFVWRCWFLLSTALMAPEDLISMAIPTTIGVCRYWIMTREIQKLNKDFELCTLNSNLSTLTMAVHCSHMASNSQSGVGVNKKLRASRTERNPERCGISNQQRMKICQRMQNLSITESLVSLANSVSSIRLCGIPTKV